MSKKPIVLALLVLVWLLTRLGQLPIKLVYYLALFLYTTYLKIISLPKFFIPKKSSFNYPKKPAKLNTIYFNQPISKEELKPKTHHPSLGWRLTLGLIRKKKRGRPRTQPYISYAGKKVKRYSNRFLPSPLRVGLALIFITGVLFAYSYFLINIAHNLPSPERLNDLAEPLTSNFYDRHGNLIYRLYEGRNRSLVKLNDLPDSLKKATIAIEDKHFYEHPGVDFFAIMRAVISDAQQREVQGGSTITQQLIKNTLLTPERTFDRKIKEVLLAYWTERLFNKDQILQMYFNEAPYGGTAWGIEAASETYFNKKAHDLDLAESAFLAGLPASPTEYSPFGAHPELAKQRQRQVLDRMTEDNYISKSQADLAFSEDLNFNSPNTFIKAPHFVMYIRSILAQKYGEKVVSQGGLQVYTTIDLDAQAMAEKVVSEEVEKLAPLRVSNGAAMITDSKSGEILAMVGSKDYFDKDVGNFNVTLAPRQPGSSIKPITYATGFKQGYSPGTILLDTPTVFKNEWETYAPVNYDGKFHGPVTIRTALGSSFNVPAVKMLALVGVPNMIATAKDLGITTFTDPNRYGLSLTLGGGEVRLIDMMSAYGTFSQMGMKHTAQGVLKVVDSAGQVLEDNQNDPGERVLSPGVAYLITNILTDNAARSLAFGPNSLLLIPGHTVAVKTGTTDNKRDNWTFGYTPEYVVGVWVGNNNNEPMDPQLTSGITGAAPIWNKIMTNLLLDKPDLAFDYFH
ncbi:PBP1A family penicillin-binding protein [Candidatus Daviesbacteria bacterium]|nr:PBP1A family penicillin-binding protein [Candidatus Daviesbacteria bacterium]